MARNKLRSMTGFGRSAASVNGVAVAVEVRSVNQRFLRVSVRLPPQLASLEHRVRELLESSGRRGQIDGLVSLENGSAACAAPDVERVRSYVDSWRKIARSLKIPGEVDVRTLAAMPELFAQEAEGQAAERAWPAVHKALKGALGHLDQMRLAEGKRLSRDLSSRVVALERQAKRITSLAGSARLHYAKKLRGRVESVLQELGALADAAVARPNLEREIAIHADRTDVSEEVQRIESHIAQFRSTLRAGSPAGRKLDFLVQELQREISTLGAKVADARAGCEAIDFRSELEKIREQVQNIE